MYEIKKAKPVATIYSCQIELEERRRRFVEIHNFQCILDRNPPDTEFGKRFREHIAELELQDLRAACSYVAPVEDWLWASVLIHATPLTALKLGSLSKDYRIMVNKLLKEKEYIAIGAYVKVVSYKRIPAEEMFQPQHTDPKITTDPHDLRIRPYHQLPGIPGEDECTYDCHGGTQCLHQTTGWLKPIPKGKVFDVGLSLELSLAKFKYFVRDIRTGRPWSKPRGLEIHTSRTTALFTPYEGISYWRTHKFICNYGNGRNKEMWNEEPSVYLRPWFNVLDEEGNLRVAGYPWVVDVMFDEPELRWKTPEEMKESRETRVRTGEEAGFWDVVKAL